MLAAEAGRVIAPGDGTADSFDLIGGYGLAVAGTTKDDALLGFPIGNFFGSGNAPEGVIGRVSSVGAAIDHLMPLSAEHIGDGLFVFKSCVVAAKGNFHGDLVA